MSGLDLTPREQLSRSEAEDFLHTEAFLLDRGRFDEWLQLFAADATYWVPCNELDHSPNNHVSLIYDTKEALAKRLLRFQRGRLVQELPSRTLHQIANVRIEHCSDAATDLVEVGCGLVLFEEHAGNSRVYPAQCRYLLRHEDAVWRIVLKKVAFLGNDNFLPTVAFLF